MHDQASENALLVDEAVDSELECTAAPAAAARELGVVSPRGRSALRLALAASALAGGLVAISAAALGSLRRPAQLSGVSEEASGTGIVEYEEGQSPPQCSSEDYGFLIALQRGDPQEFFHALASCSKASVTWRLSFDDGSFTRCMQGGKFRQTLSEPCMRCYGLNGQFALSNCKLPCLFRWCSATCLKCTAKNERQFSQCLGRPPHEMPHARAC